MKKLYVLVRSDLKSLQYRGVQAGHGVAQWMLKFPDSQWKNGTLIYVDVADEHALQKWCFKLQDRKMEYAEFFEPDIGNQRTAISCLTDTNIFSNLPLMS